jgi:hypothetical protein
MNKRFAKPLRSGLIAVGLLAGLAATPLLAGPMPQPVPAAPSADAGVIHVRDSWAGGNNHNRGTVWRHRGHRDHWRGRDRWRHDHRRYRHHRHYHGGSGLYFGLGILPSYNYRVVPRRHYRAGSAHVRWCYNRYRSYRAWDNTFQPYHGPRRQCRSPY